MIWNKDSNNLICAILLLENEDEARNFLRDLLTEKEIREFSMRLKTAFMLESGVSYMAISKETGLSSTTIARISRWLNGKGGGYKAILKKIKSVF